MILGFFSQVVVEKLQNMTPEERKELDKKIEAENKPK